MATEQRIKKAGYRERMIEIDVRFFTDGFDDRRGYIMPKHGWTVGSIGIRRNDSHGIVPQNPRIFRSLMEIPQVIERVLIEHEIVLHRSVKAEKYIE